MGVQIRSPRTEGGGSEQGGPALVPMLKSLHRGPKWGFQTPCPPGSATQARIQGGGGGRDPPPPALDHQQTTSFFNKLFKYMWITSHGQCPGGVLVNVQEWVYFSIFRRADDVTRTMSRGVCACECPRVGYLSFFGGRMTSRGQCPRGGGVLVNVLTPPPLQEILYPRLATAPLPNHNHPLLQYVSTLDK